MTTTLTTPVLQQHNMPSAIVPCEIPGDTTGAMTLKAGAAGYQIDVWGLLLTASGTTIVTISSGSTVLKSLCLQAGQTISVPLPFGPAQAGQTKAFPVCQTIDGDDLKIAWTGSSIPLAGSVYINQRVTGV